MEKQPEATVRGLLAGARLTVSEEELDRLVRVYPVLRSQVDALYDIDLDADVPALAFDPDPGQS